ncbi:MAG: hypothetical protein ACQETB_07260 [Halobacteriota archaeon]
MDRIDRRLLRLVGAIAFAGVAIVVATGEVAAHAAALRDAAPSTLEVPTWLFLTTGGGAVGASFLLASFVTDRVFIRSFHTWGGSLPSPGRVVASIGRLLGVFLLVLTVYIGFVGPPTGYRNFAVLFVWVVWWGGYVATTYLLGNTWSTLNPFRTIAEGVPTIGIRYPDRLGRWPSVAGLLILVWIEVVSPLADDPQVLAGTIVGYAIVSVLGSIAFGADTWFSNVDPISRALGYFGRFAPFERSDSGIRYRLPGMSLSDPAIVSGRDEVAFIVCLLYVTTFDGFVATWLWADIAVFVVGVGGHPVAVYAIGYLLGFGLFLGAFWWAIGLARRLGNTYITRDELARRFAPSLVAIAVGYHLAHNLTVVLGLLPSVLVVAAGPFAPPQQPPILAGLPGWVSGVELAFVLVGHFVAVWVAHAAAYDLFPGRLDAIRSQYGITIVMVGYTIVSLWIVTTPIVEPPYIAGGEAP